MKDKQKYKIKYKPSDMPFISEIDAEYFIDSSIEVTVKKAVEIINDDMSDFNYQPISEVDIINIKKMD
jgi:hypothetical protein